MKVEIVFRATRKLNCSVGYLSPAAKCREVIASFKPGSKDFFITCRSFESVSQLCSAVHWTFLVASAGNWKTNARLLSSAISWSYWPYCSLLNAESQRRTHMDLHCFCLLLCRRTTWNAACVSIMACCPWSNQTCCNSLLLSILQIDWK